MEQLLGHIGLNSREKHRVVVVRLARDARGYSCAIEAF